MSTQDRISRIESLIAQLAEREEYYEAFLNASPWGILVVDEAFRIVYINKTMENICGYTLEDIDGRHLHTLIPKDIRSVHSRHEEDYVMNPRVRYGDHPFRPQILHRDGSLVDVEISLAPSEVRGETYFFASIRPRNTLQPAAEPEDMSPGPTEYDMDELDQ